MCPYCWWTEGFSLISPFPVHLPVIPKSTFKTHFPPLIWALICGPHWVSSSLCKKKKKKNSNRISGSLSKSFLALNNCLENVRAVAPLGNYIRGCQLPTEHSGALTHVWRGAVDHLGLMTGSWWSLLLNPTFSSLMGASSFHTHRPCPQEGHPVYTGQAVLWLLGKK